MKMNEKIDKLAGLRRKAMQAKADRLGLGSTLGRGVRTLRSWGLTDDDFDFEVVTCDASEDVRSGRAKPTDEDNVHISFEIDTGCRYSVHLRLYTGDDLHYGDSGILTAEDLWNAIQEHLEEGVR